MILLPLAGRWWRKTQGFGVNPGDYAQFGLRGHNGLDLAPFPLRIPLTVCAPHNGYVTLGDQGREGYGKFVEILSEPIDREKTQHRSDLAHLSQFLVKDGQFVFQGDPIGIMGNTGFSSGLHLHWTFKRVRGGLTLDKNNGFNGAIDVSRYALYWSGAHLA